MKKKNNPYHIKEQEILYNDRKSEFQNMEYERYEMIEGIRYDLKPAPTILHQEISAAVFIALHPYVS